MNDDDEVLEEEDNAEETIEPKKKHKSLPPLFQSEFTMGELEFKRFHALFTWKDYCAIQVNSLNLEYCQPYYAVLKQIYKNIRWILAQKIKVKLDRAFLVLRQLINSEVLSKIGMGTLSYRMLDLFDEIDMELMSVKQLSGLGIAVRRKESKYAKAKRALNA